MMKKEYRYLLDTNICIAWLRGDKAVAHKIIATGEHKCCLSVITVYELMFGAWYSGHKEQEITKVKSIIKRFPIIPLPCDGKDYAQQKAALRASGIMIDEFDLLIASTALSENCILVTDNLKHFQRIKELQIENWVERN